MKQKFLKIESVIELKKLTVEEKRNNEKDQKNKNKNS